MSLITGKITSMGFRIWDESCSSGVSSDQGDSLWLNCHQSDAVPGGPEFEATLSNNFYISLKF
jgi:hypothetical protein